MRRELVLVFGARVTWGVAALVAAVVGHSFVLAVDLYGQASASVAAGSLAAREFEPLLAILRPTIGGWSFCATLIGPVLAARVLAAEKDRRTFHARLLALGSAPRLLARKALAAWLGLLLLAAPIVVCALAWLAAGGHLDVRESCVVLLGVALHAGWIAAVSTAAAAWSASTPQATALALLLSVSPWILDAAGEFAALAWLGPVQRLSISPHLAGFERAVLQPGAVAWLVLAWLGALVLACIGARDDWTRGRRGASAVLVCVATLATLLAADRWRGGWDLSEAQHSSLPRSIALAVEALPSPLVLDIGLDRDDARRAQLEQDVVLRLELVRPDLVVRFPLDGAASSAGVRGGDYGRILVQVGDRAVETFSTSRRELITLLFEAAQRPMPAWEYPPYAGHPQVLGGGARSAVAVVVYLLIPLLLGAVALTKPGERAR
ncbi:MAG: hypothetical protein IPJ56_18030 [Gemmatimonadetes bacterium]|jgi:hypothetical protein|nr:hypothetical protein [Gemmatimonadota bacterium]